MTIERHYTTRELAEMLHVNPETIRRAARRGELQSLRVGLERRYPESAVVEWLGSLASPSPVRPAA
jgi:excisionase family DNA binding protein